MIIQATNIHKSFSSLEVLKGIDLTVQQGEIISIVGASGAGKTTLLQILGTLEQADPGASIQVLGEEVTGLGTRRTAELRNRTMGFIFQAHQLLPEFTALENVMIPAMILGESKDTIRERALQLLDRLGLRERASHKPSQLSGGESQRVAVARALINEPAVIFADEPSGSLDTANKESLHQLIFDLRRELGQTFVIVTHDPEFARRADRMIVLKDGRIQSIEDAPSRYAPSPGATSLSSSAPTATPSPTPTATTPSTSTATPSPAPVAKASSTPTTAPSPAPMAKSVEPAPSSPAVQPEAVIPRPESKPSPEVSRPATPKRPTAQASSQPTTQAIPPTATKSQPRPVSQPRLQPTAHPHAQPAVSQRPSSTKSNPLAPKRPKAPIDPQDSEDGPEPVTICISPEPPTLSMSSTPEPASKGVTPEDPEEARTRALAEAIEQVW